jgi:cytochrome c1
MAFTYQSGLDRTRDQVRFLIQDTNEALPLFQDEEIDWMLTQEANVYMAAAALCDIRVTQVGGGGKGIKRKKVGDLDITYNADHYKALSATLKARGMGHQVPYAGGTSVTDKTAQKQNTDWVRPAVPRGILENPQAPKPDQPSDGNDPSTVR